MTFARIPGSASTITPGAIEEGVGRVASMALADSGFRSPFHEALGLRVVDVAAGIVEIDKTDYVRNSFGTINGGVVAATFAAAAEAAGASASGAPVEALDLQVHYLAQTKEGPARTSAEVLRHDDRSAVVRLELHDVSDGTLLALATVGVGLPPS
jgi:acyl-coenzyme A thioesterase PaaI-like protein